MKSWPLCATIILLCIFDIHETELPCSSSDEAMQIAKRAAPTLTAKFPHSGVGASLQRSPLYHLVYISNIRARAPYTQSPNKFPYKNPCQNRNSLMRKQQKAPTYTTPDTINPPHNPLNLISFKDKTGNKRTNVDLTPKDKPPKSRINSPLDITGTLFKEVENDPARVEGEGKHHNKYHVETLILKHDSTNNINANEHSHHPFNRPQSSPYYLIQPIIIEKKQKIPTAGSSTDTKKSQQIQLYCIKKKKRVKGKNKNK